MTNANVLPPRKRPALLWGAVCLLLLGMLLTLLPQARLNSSVLAMLPKQTLGAIPPALNDGFMQRLDRQLVWLVSPGKKADPAVARAWLTQLQNSTLLAEVKGPMDAESHRRGVPSSGSTVTALSITIPAHGLSMAARRRRSGSFPSSIRPSPA